MDTYYDSLTIDTVERGPFTLTIRYDDDAQDPRTDGDWIVTTFVLPNGGARGALGSEVPTVNVDTTDGDHEEWDESCPHDGCYGTWHEIAQDDGRDDFGDLLAADLGALAVLPLRYWTGQGSELDVLDYPGGWADANGYAAVYARDMDRLGVPHADAAAHAEQDARIFAQYLAGEVYVYEVEGPNAYDGCGGFYDQDGASEQGKDALNHAYNAWEREQIEQDATYATVPGQ